MADPLTVPLTVPWRMHVGPVTSMVPLNASPVWAIFIVKPPFALPHFGPFCQVPTQVPVTPSPAAEGRALGDVDGFVEADTDGAGEGGADTSADAEVVGAGTEAAAFLVGADVPPGAAVAQALSRPTSATIRNRAHARPNMAGQL